ncbi:MAG: metallophosphoesterase family protein [Acidobacteria bacterium]|nr:metallophosphoesterase family protein [Acidobacteriota bacterium]
MNRGICIKMAALLLALLIQTPSPSQTANTGATETPDHIALTWTGSPETTMTITWRTDPSVTSGIVQYQKGSKLSKKAKQAKAEPREFVADLGPSRLFTATLANLSPNTKYSYRVGDGEHWSDLSTFSTAKRKTRSFKFLVFGDSQAPLKAEEPYGHWRKTLHNAFAANPDAKFMVNVGDLVDYGQNGAHWNAWFAAAKGVLNRIPQMPVMGNHEYYGSKDMTKAPYYLAQWSVPQNGPEGLKSQAYSYDYGPVHFVVLDSQYEEQKKHGDVLKIQQPWLEADLAASKAMWKIVFFHKPAYESYPKRTNPQVKAAFCPILEKYNVDLVFNAHDHAIARSYPIRNGVLMQRPSQGIIYYMSGHSGGKTYKTLQKMEWNTFFHHPVDQPNYFVLEVKDKKLTVKTIYQDGTVLDVFFIDKAKDVSSDSLTQPETARPEEEKRAA